jgi:membrane protease YdiL (CAAX protease family)
MPIWMHIAIFGVTGLAIYLGIYYGVPWLLEKNVSLLAAFFFFLWLPVIPLLPLSLYLYATVEGGQLSFAAVAERFRLVPIQGREWLWVGGAVLVTAVADELLQPIGKALARTRLFAPPAFLPAPFNPLKEFRFPPPEFMGVPLKGNWRLLLAFVPLHLLAMFSEEMMWRGYMLPLQIEVLGNWAWVLNGILWAWLVHAVLKWHLIGMLPGMLAAPLVAQITQSTWASVIAHVVPNMLLWGLLLLGVLGVGTRPSVEDG